MSVNKKIVIPVVLAVVVVAGTVLGVTMAFASDSTTPTTTTATVTTNPKDTLATKVAAILGIDEAKVQAAFTQAQKEIQAEQLDKQLAQLVTDGKITQAQADAYKAWLNTKPDDTAYQNSMKTWMDANPLANSNVQLPGIIGAGKMPGGNMPGGFGRMP